MGFLDKMKDAAQSAKDKVSDATGIDTDKAWETGKSLARPARASTTRRTRGVRPAQALIAIGGRADAACVRPSSP